MVLWTIIDSESVVQRFNVTLEYDSGFDFQETTEGKQELTRKNGDRDGSLANLPFRVPQG